MPRRINPQTVCLFLSTIFLLVSFAWKSSALSLALQQAQTYYQQGKYQNVIEILTDDQDPQEAGVYEYLAASYQKLGQTAEALLDWQKAKELYLEQQNYHRATLSEQNLR